VKTKIALFLSVVFLFSGLPMEDPAEVRAELDFGAEEDASPVQDPDISFSSSRSTPLRNRPLRRKSSVEVREGFHARPGHFSRAGKIKEITQSSDFSQQQIYSLQQVFRL
jgi:hypothetical protein